MSRQNEDSFRKQHCSNMGTLMWVHEDNSVIKAQKNINWEENLEVSKFEDELLDSHYNEKAWYPCEQTNISDERNGSRKDSSSNESCNDQGDTFTITQDMRKAYPLSNFKHLMQSPNTSNAKEENTAVETMISNENIAANEESIVKIPVIYVSPIGMMTVVFKDVLVEIAGDRSIRIVCHDKFAGAVDGTMKSSCIIHKNAKMTQENENAYCTFGTSEGKMKKALLHPSRILFTISDMEQAYMISPLLRGISFTAYCETRFEEKPFDATLKLFYDPKRVDPQFIPLCENLVRQARYRVNKAGLIFLNINGIDMIQRQNGDLTIGNRPRIIRCSPSKGTIHLKTDFVEMAVQDDERCFMKQGSNHIRVSTSGMVITDGNNITSMNEEGKIIAMD